MICYVHVYKIRHAPIISGSALSNVQALFVAGGNRTDVLSVRDAPTTVVKVGDNYMQ